MHESMNKITCVNNLLTTETLNTDEELDEGIQQLWILESVGIKDTDHTNENKIMAERFNDSLIYDGNKYYVELPWKIPCPDLLDNFNIAKAHLFKNYKKLKNSNKLDLYNEIFKEQLELGFIEEVKKDPFNKVGCHYLTHRGVYREDSLTTKLRIVYNCSLKDSNKTSLNNCLIEGPNLVNDLVKVLLRFRLDKYAIVSDISKAFLRINLKLDYDKDHLRFLWFKDPFNTNKGLTTYRFKVILFGANCSPSILALTIKNHLNRFPESVALNLLKNSFYVDNVLGSVSSEEELITFYEESKAIMNKGNFKLTEWISNSNSLNSLINKENLGYSGDISKIKALGINWILDENSDKYDFICTKPYNIKENASTKRQILAESSKVYDPLGLFLPVTIRSRMFLQGLWKKSVGWDETLEPVDIKIWQKLAKDLNKVQTIKVNRYTGERSKINTLHIFTDASSQAYGCCAYLVNDTSNLVYSKSKVTPIKNKRSIPQLELLAVTLGVKISKFLLETFKDVNIKDVYLWSDSQVCLNWLQQGKNSNNKNVFVKNRLHEIEKCDVFINYRFVSTHQNPSDFLSRGLSFKLIKSNKSWFHGPKFLLDKNQWEETPILCKINKTIINSSLVSDPLFDVNKFSNFNKVIRITNYCLKFINKCRKNKLIKFDAHHYWLSYIQKKEFSQEYSFIHSNSKYKPETGLSLISDLNLFLDSEGLLRCKGRVNKSKLTYNAKHPILLPRNNHLTDLIIRDTHIRVYHMGVSQTLTELRKTFWVPKGRVTVKSVLNTCTTCKRIHSHSYKTPSPPQLPTERVNFSYPFESTGIDYTAAINISLNDVTFKVYIVLFTCSATRAISLDVVEDLTTGAFVAAFRRFCAKHNIPRVVWTDNALYFKGGEKVIQNLFDSNEITNYFQQNNIKWKYIPVKSPWYGSIWERSIQSVKNCIKKSVGLNKLNLFELLTLITEIENVVNNRPLTYVDNEIDDFEPLTPNHLLKGYSTNLLPENTIYDDIDYSVDHIGLNNELNKKLKIKNQFVSRWEAEYLASLRERHKDCYNNKYWEDSIRIGDIVLIQDATPRLTWSLGRVIDLLTGEDGVTRVARLKTSSGETTRDITLLYLLEYNYNNSDSSNEEESNVNNLESPVLKTTNRPKRKAATKADLFLKSKIKKGEI